MHAFRKSVGNFGGSVVRRPVEHDSAAAMSNLLHFRIASINFTTAFTGRQHAALIRSILL